MNADFQQAQSTIKALCAVFSDCADPRARDFVAAGISSTGGIPSVIVFAPREEPTRQYIRDRLGESLAGVEIVTSGGLSQAGVADPAAGSRSAAWIGRPLASLKAAGRSIRSWLRALAQPAPVSVHAGVQVDDGTVGCGLREKQTGAAHFLTDLHVLRSKTRGATAVLQNGDHIARLKDWSRVASDPDWAVLAAIRNVLPSACLNWEACALTLQGPMTKGDLPLLGGQIIGMGGATSGERRRGVVTATGACVVVAESTANGGCTRLMAMEQILVKNLAGQRPFGEQGDSGAVAYVLPPPPALGANPAGTAVGLYWLRNPTGDLHALAPLVDVLDAIKRSPSMLDLELWR
jgi:hypothetical protein